MTPVWTQTNHLDLALLLVAAQLLASYGWPATALVAAPRGVARNLGRILVLVLVQSLVLLPWLGPWLLAGIVALTIAQVLVAALGSPGESRRPALLLRNQAWYLLVVAAVWYVMTREPRLVWPLLPEGRGLWQLWFASLAVLAVVLRGGMTMTALLLAQFPGLPFEPDTARMGRTIGVLERALVLLLVVLDQWSTVGLVIAAKSVARFEDLKQRHFAEYYLIGTLSSLLLACLGGLVIRLLIHA